MHVSTEQVGVVGPITPFLHRFEKEHMLVLSARQVFTFHDIGCIFMSTPWYAANHHQPQ